MELFRVMLPLTTALGPAGLTSLAQGVSFNGTDELLAWFMNFELPLALRGLWGLGVSPRAACSAGGRTAGLALCWEWFLLLQGCRGPSNPDSLQEMGSFSAILELWALS